MGRLWENVQKLERIQEHVAEDHEWQDMETATRVLGVGNNLRLRPAWRSMTGVFMSTIALYALRVCTVWEIFCDRVLPVGAWQERTCGH